MHSNMLGKRGKKLPTLYAWPMVDNKRSLKGCFVLSIKRLIYYREFLLEYKYFLGPFRGLTEQDSAAIMYYFICPNTVSFIALTGKLLSVVLP